MGMGSICSISPVNGMPATEFDPMALGVGSHIVEMTFDGADDGNGGVSPDGGTTAASPGCIQVVRQTVMVGGPWWFNR